MCMMNFHTYLASQDNMIITLTNLIILIFSIALLHRLKSKKIQLSFQILVSLALGVLFGFLLKISPINWLFFAVQNILSLMGRGYLALLKMLVIPLILTSIIHAILDLGTENSAAIKKLSFLTCFMLLGMTAISSLIGIIMGIFFTVGAGLSLPTLIETPSHTYTGLLDTLLAMVPSNPVAIMTKENTIAIVLFSVLLGLAARKLDLKDHDKMNTFREFIASLFAIVKKLTQLVLGLTPYGILALIALLILEQGTIVLSGMLNFILAMYMAMLLVFVMHGIILLFFKQNPWDFLKKRAFLYLWHLRRVLVLGHCL